MHRYGDSFVCATDARGHATPGNRSRFEIVVDASEGFIPLWAQHQVLRWTFDEVSLSYFKNPEAIKAYLRELLGEALMGWGMSVPIRFSENSDNSDFQIDVRQADSCTPYGCTLARAFFPDGGRHRLVVFPKMFGQSRKEQVETMMHELGHVFGLRHFFAKIHETAWPAEIFGEHKPFSIMNYGSKSVLTDADKNDLYQLYRMAWSGNLVEINGTPIHLVKPFHTMGIV
ncbi:matrix metalloproteinase-11 [Flavobacteriaceae bacterium TP-CH-4]|uniref:Matrix metalloproteinase-11 n=1 Tax=Pelagihabitans pacificus TaxID=2696054 RepID=A0A967E479_9FLAO|nr:matrix metalloproteinase-11 [Pelagihabitans pacificus]